MLMAAIVSAPLLGFYVVAVAIAGLANLPIITLNVIAVPQIASEADAAVRAHRWGRLLRVSLLLQLLFGCALWVLTPYIVSVCFGPPFAPSTGVARILILASVPLGMNMMLATGFRASNRPLTPSTAEVISVIVTAVGLPWLLPRYGIAGAAWTSVVAYTVTCMFLLSRLQSHLGITPRQLLEPRMKDWSDARSLFLRRHPENA
jgi:O-antigen/teichoic acid export membrane protein